MNFRFQISNLKLAGLQERLAGTAYPPQLSTLNSQLSTHSAFTLIEVLLAVTVFALVLTAINVVFYSAVRLRNKTTSDLEAAVPLQLTLAIMKRDLANLVMPGGTLFGELQTTATATNSQGQLQTDPTAALISTRAQVSPYFFTTSALLEDDLPWGEVQKVCYFLQQPTNNAPGRDLVRIVTRNLLPAVSGQPEDAQFLMSGVENLVTWFYDGSQWRQDWDSTTETNKVPLAIKIELELAQDQPTRNNAQPPILLVVPIQLRAPTNQTAQASGSSGGGQ
jgi:type II secretion system protein J